MAMKTRCERDSHGREVGVIEHDGREFRALGASTVGPYLSAYLKAERFSPNYASAVLTTWCGRVILDSRAEVCETHWTEENGQTYGIIFRLTNRRAIVGYALGGGMLFRGELIESREWDTERELRHLCNRVCREWMEKDREDAAEFQEQQEREEREEREREEQELEDAAELDLSRM